MYANFSRYYEQVPLNLAFGLLDRGFRLGDSADAARVPPLPWLGISLALTIVAHRFGGRRLALLAGITCLYLVFFNQWSSAMRTMTRPRVAHTRTCQPSFSFAV